MQDLESLQIFFKIMKIIPRWEIEFEGKLMIRVDGETPDRTI